MKKLFRVSCFLLFSFGLSVIAFGQDRFIKRGNKLYDKYKFHKAIKCYKKAYDIDSSYLSSKKLALAYQANYQLGRAETYFQLALNHPEKETELHLAYAEFLASNRRFTESKKELTTFLTAYPEHEKGTLMLNYLIEREQYDCNPVMATNDPLFYCVSLDARASIDESMPHLVFIWNFDDETELTGTIVNHCFGKSGIHTVDLSTLDTLTNFRSATDTTFTLDLSEQLNFTTSGSTIKGSEIIFDASKLKNIKNLEGFLWELGDGHYKTGRQISHRYTKQGLYRSRLYILIRENDKVEILGCVGKPIFINKSILNIGRK